MKRLLTAALASAAILLAPALRADEAQVKAELDQLAAQLVKRLALDKKHSLRSIPPDQAGLPADFLGKLMTDLEAALLVASEFELELSNRMATEEVWQEAIEFNNADFDKLHKAAKADVMLLLRPRATAKGVEVSLTAHALVGPDAGRVIASSGSVLLPMSVKDNLGVDINDLNAQMAKVLAEIEKIGASGGLVGKPDNYAQFYHNARILQQRGEVDLAMANYRSAVAEGFLFVDPVSDLMDLANSRYGARGARIFFEKKVLPTLPPELKMSVDLELGREPLDFVQPIIDGDVKFAPFLAAWLKATFSEWKKFDSLTVGRARVRAADLIKHAHSSGKFQSFYIDKIRGAAAAEEAIGMFKSMTSSGQIVVDRMSISRTSVHYGRVSNGDRRSRITQFSIQDDVDLTKPIELCLAAASDGAGKVCKPIDTSRNSVGAHSHVRWFSTIDPLEWSVGLSCAVSIRYVDLHGFEVRSPVLVNRTLTKGNLPSNWQQIDSCAGEYLRLRS